MRRGSMFEEEERIKAHLEEAKSFLLFIVSDVAARIKSRDWGARKRRKRQKEEEEEEEEERKKEKYL